MFTGIVEETGTIKGIRTDGKFSRIVISATRVLSDMKIGDSINTDGICLTVTEFTNNAFSVDVMPETMSRTSLGRLRVGNKVNLERALRLTDRLGGHIVSGHIDGTGTLERVRNDGNAVWLTVAAGTGLLKYIVDKGSVAIDGISLTVVRSGPRSFEVSLIPFTQGETAILLKKTGDPVNIECDIIGKYVEKLGAVGRVNVNFLAENGFV